MRKIKSLFKWAFAAALIFGSSGLAKAAYSIEAIAGTHTFTADLEIVDQSYASIYEGTDNFEFTIDAPVAQGYNPDFAIGFLKCSAIWQFQLDETTGQLKIQNYYKPTGSTANVYVTSLENEGKWGGMGYGNSTFVWQMTEDGKLTVPDFAINTYSNTNPTVIARYKNVKIDAQSISYPTIDELLGTYTFTAANYTSTNETLYPKTFDITIKQIGDTYYMGDFLNSTNNASVAIDYDQETGIISYKKVMQSNTWALVPEDGGWTGWNLNQGANMLKFKYDPETGGFALGNFTVQGVASNAANGTILASYGNITILPYKVEETVPDDTGDMGPDPGKHPSWDDLVARGKYYFTADVDIEEGMEAAWGEIVNNAADSQFTFITTGTNKQISGFLGSTQNKTITYNETEGTLGMLYMNSNLNFSGRTLRLADANGNFYDNFTPAQWATVDNWGRITIAPFTLKEDSSNGKVIAHFNNCRVNGFPVDGGGVAGGEDDEPGGNYPAPSQLSGKHGWAANINVKNEELYNAYLEKHYRDNTFSIGYNDASNQISVEGLLDSSTVIYGTYNQKTGVVTFANQTLGYENTTGLKYDGQDNTPLSVNFNITDATDTKANGNWTWQVAELNEDGTGDIEITIPDFTIWNQRYTNPGPIAEYLNFELDGIQVFDPDPVVPSESATVIGTYDWAIQYSNGLFYSTNDATAEIKVEVLKDTDYYFIRETGETNYFQGFAIPFTLSEDGDATFTPTYIGKDDQDQIIFSDIAYIESDMYMPMTSQMIIPFDEEDGFYFKENQGIGLYTSNDMEEYEPQDAIFACILITLPENYPTASQIEGTYKFTSKGFEKYEVADVPNSKSACKLDVNLLQDEFLFTISRGEGGKMIVSHMFYGGFSLGNIRVGQSTYDETTGQLTFDHSVVYDGAAIMAGIAPDGKWGGISAGATKPLVLQFHEDRSITVPMFQLVKYDAAKVDGVYAEYNRNKAVPYVSEAESGPIVSNPEIEGIWNIDYFDIVNSSEGGGKATGSYMAYLKGNVVTFQEQASGDASGEGTYHIIARFTDETTLLVERATVSNPNASQPLNQIPFTNGKTEQSDNPTYLNKEEWTFKYDAAAGTLTPSGSACGLWYANFAWGTDNQTTEIQAAYIINGGKKASDFVPTVTISNMKAQTSGNSATISFNVATEYWDNVEVAKWKAFAQTYRSEGETDITEDYEADATVDLTAGTGQFTVTGLPNGCAGFPMVYIVAYDKDGIQIAKSNGKSITFEINSGLTLSDFSYQMGEGNSNMTVTFRAMPTSPVNLSDFDSWTAYFRNDADGTTYALDATVVEKGNATIKYLEATVVFEELLPGQHDFYVRLVGYKGDAEVISNAVEYNWDADVQGVPQEGFGSCVIISNANAAVSEEGVVTVTFYIETQNVKEEAGLIYEAILTPAKVAQEGAENAADGDLTFDFTPAVDGKGTLTLDDLEAGTYAYNLTVNVYNEETLVAGTLEAAYITFIIQGEEPVDPDQPDDAVEGIVIDSDARYFNLQGLEIKNPEKGIYIKIENGKITKVVK